MKILDIQTERKPVNNKLIEPSWNTPLKPSEKTYSVIRRYGDGESFAKIFSPSLQVVCAQNIERAFLGDAPSLVLLSQTYPEDQMNTWVIAHLMDLYKFAGVKEKPSFSQVLELAVMIRTEYYYLKASELLLFFFRFKAGEYGTFYGVVDPMVIMAALIDFRAYRRQQIEMYDREIQRKKREEEWVKWEKNAVPCPEYLKLAKAFVEEVKSTK
nr:MAG TPA: hypothetical protein [Caudoviricetes sp.]